MTKNPYPEAMRPLREHRQPYAILRDYPERPGRQQRIEGDQRLLIALQQECDRRQPLGGKTPTVAELPESTLHEIVADTEALQFGHWQLAGDESEPLLDRLDRHFAELQESWLEARLASDADMERRRDESLAFDRQMAEQQHEAAKAWARAVLGTAA